MCAALSAHWIKARAIDDRDLPAQLGLTPYKSQIFCGATFYKSLNITLLRRIARDQVNWSSADQQWSIWTWLESHGVEKDPAMSSIGGFLYTPHEIEVEIVQNLEIVNNAYAYISFGRVLGDGHAVAAWFGPGEAANGEGAALFFDPNFGEYRFEQRSHFNNFFKEYYQAKYKGCPYRFTGRWEIGAYSPVELQV
jgi:hypothetical protein